MHPGLAVATHTSTRLNALYAGMPACSTYLEIGVQHGHTLESVEVPFRWGVDPFPTFDVSELSDGCRFSKQESDTFFAGLARQQFFDLVLLDGLHEWRQTYRDLINVLMHTPDHAVILIDDVVPDDELSAIPDQAMALEKKRAAGILDSRWHGDVFKVLVAIVQFHPELDFRVVGVNALNDNPQALVWRRERGRPEYSRLREKDLDHALNEVTYPDVFPDGRIPSGFRPTPEGRGIDDALAGSRAAWDSR